MLGCSRSGRRWHHNNLANASKTGTRDGLPVASITAGSYTQMTKQRSRKRRPVHNRQLQTATGTHVTGFTRRTAERDVFDIRRFNREAC